MASAEASWPPAPWLRLVDSERRYSWPGLWSAFRRRVLGTRHNLSDGTSVLGRTLLLASGVEWRRLEVPGIDELLGAGRLLRSRTERGLGLRRSARCRRWWRELCRSGRGPVLAVCGPSDAPRAGTGLAASMSKYLIDAIAAIPNVDVRTGTQVVGRQGRRSVAGGSRHVRADSHARNPCALTPCSSASAASRERTLSDGTGLVVDDAGLRPDGK